MDTGHVSAFVSKSMDYLGYSNEMVRFRQDIEEDCDRLLNRHDTLRHMRYTTGGKIEGTKIYYQFDFDFLYELRNVVCAENSEYVVHSNSAILLQLERDKTAPGYATVRLVSFCINKNCNLIRESLLDAEDGSRYLSSELFIASLQNSQRQRQQRDKYLTYARDGPSLPESDEFIKCDKVTCFRCFNSEIYRFCSRNRRWDFPSQRTLENLTHVPLHIVPVGFRGSMDRYQEWRMSFAIAEKHLMKSLNDTQLKVYVVLKLTAKSILKPLCQEMTSYIMKNVLLWQCEMNGYGKFMESTLLSRLYGCMIYLRECVSNNYLPSYILPDKNLLAGRLNLHERQSLTAMLSELLNEKECFLFRLQNLKNCMMTMHTCPERIYTFANMRDVLEKMVLLSQWFRYAVIVPGMSREEKYACARQNAAYRELESRIDNLISVDEDQLLHNGKTPQEIDKIRNIRLKAILS